MCNECDIEDVEDDEPSKSSKDSKKKSGEDFAKERSLVFKIINKVQYKTVLKAHSALVLKAESMAEKIEWVNKIENVIQPSKGIATQGIPGVDGSTSMKHSHSDGSLESVARKPADQEEELRWMSQEVRGYVEAVLNSLAANVPKAVILCQVQKAKEDMLNQLYSSVSAQSTAKIEELIQEDQNVKGRRELIQKQSDLLSKITRHLSVHDNRTTDTNWSDSSSGAESSPRNSAPSSGGEWKNAFDAAANGSNSFSRSSSHNRRYSDPAQSGIEPNSLVANSGSRRIPNRPPPPLPQSTSSSMYKY